MEKDKQTTSYAICAFCKRTMAPGCGCDVAQIESDDVRYERIKVGDPNDTFHDMDGEVTCHDCNARKGQYHHVGCACDRCPICHDQFFICRCVPHAYINTYAD